MSHPTPGGRSSDRADQQANSDKLDELLRNQAAPAVAVSPTDLSSDRAQADANQTENLERNTADRAQADANQVITEGRLDSLVAVSAALSNSATMVADSTRQELAAAAAQRRRFAVLAVGMALAVLSLLIPVLFIAVSGSHERRAILDCVRPTGKCLQDAQSRTAKAVENVNQVAILAAACAPDYVRLPLPQRIAAIRRCVVTGMQADAKAKAKAKAKTAPKLPPPTLRPTLPRSAPRPGTRPQPSAALSRTVTGAQQPGRTAPTNAGPRPSASATPPPTRAPAPPAPPPLVCITLAIGGRVCV